MNDHLSFNINSHEGPSFWANQSVSKSTSQYLCDHHHCFKSPRTHQLIHQPVNISVTSVILQKPTNQSTYQVNQSVNQSISLWPVSYCKSPAISQSFSQSSQSVSQPVNISVTIIMLQKPSNQSIIQSVKSVSQSTSQHLCDQCHTAKAQEPTCWEKAPAAQRLAPRLAWLAPADFLQTHTDTHLLITVTARGTVPFLAKKYIDIIIPYKPNHWQCFSSSSFFK